MRLLSVLALDRFRFGDFVFVGDAVVCPVRESMGQPMGVVLGGLSSSIMISVARVVRHVIDNREWHTRHAAMIIVKYILSVSEGSSLCHTTEGTNLVSHYINLYLTLVNLRPGLGLNWNFTQALLT